MLLGSHRRWMMRLCLFQAFLALAVASSRLSADFDPTAALKKSYKCGSYAYARYSSGSGKGSATVKCAAPVLAGSTLGEVLIEYSADSGGIAPGGRVIITFPADCSSPQIDDETKPSFVSVHADSETVETSLEMVYISRAKPVPGDSAHRRMLTAKLPKGLPKNGKVSALWKNAAITGCARGWNGGRVTFAVYVDHDADGWEEEITASPWVAVMPLAAEKLVPIVRSTAVVGEPVRCVVSALDKFNNPALGYRGAVRFESTDPGARLPAPYRFTEHDASSATFDFVFSTPGFHWTTVIEEATGRKVDSNPVEVCKTRPPYSLYWGDLHVHTRRSADAASWVPAPLDYREAYQVGRYRAGLDFMANADHHGLNQGNYDQSQWALMQRITNEANAPGAFATIVGMEISAGIGDQNVYTAGDALPFFNVGPRHPLDLWESFKGKDYIAVPHHIAQSMRPWDWKYYEAVVNPVAEIFSEHGRAEFTGNVPHYSRHPKATLEGRTWRDQLDAGRKIGCIASSDDHWCRPGSSGLAAVWAPTLTRAAVFEQITKRHCYASTNARAILHFAVSGSEMGTEISSTSAPEVHTWGATPAQISEIVVVKNGVEIPLKHENGRTFDIKWRDPAFDGDAYYYVRVAMKGSLPGGSHGAGPHYVWSSPVWVKAERSLDNRAHREAL